MQYPDDEWQQRYMQELEAQIWEWKTAYYLGHSLVDDNTFDLWWRNLMWLEGKYPHLANPESPTQGVGYRYPA